MSRTARARAQAILFAAVCSLIAGGLTGCVIDGGWCAPHHSHGGHHHHHGGHCR